MQDVADIVLKDREHAGRLLAERLMSYKGANAIIAGIPDGGLVVAASIAETLGLPLVAWPCRRIKHPADNTRSIGSVCANDVFIRHCSRTIPQDYLYHQIAMLRSAIQSDLKQYFSCALDSLRDKVVILVDDLLESSDSIMACIRGIGKMAPAKIVVAAPVVNPEAVRNLEPHSDEIVCLFKDPFIRVAEEYFGDIRGVGSNQVRKQLVSSSGLIGGLIPYE